MIFQPASERAILPRAGFWILPDLRLGGGYNLTSTKACRVDVIRVASSATIFRLSNLLICLNVKGGARYREKDDRRRKA